ncbi:hypothetical protein NC652_040360 [Populus alba x Populus x berolinensis]|nr:hypothetical protein NC652_040360 [Populus alba x Populus x berolinensis]
MKLQGSVSSVLWQLWFESTRLCSQRETEDLNLSSESAPTLLFDKYEEEVWGKTPDHWTDNGSCLNLHLKTWKERFIY